MVENILTLVRFDLSREFFPFQTENKKLLEAMTKFRAECANAPGFISLNYIISEDRLKMQVITLWESMEAQSNLISKHHAEFQKEVREYNFKNMADTSHSTRIISDTKEIKEKKNNSRISAKTMSDELRKFITGSVT